jgi:hypothetical protein
MTDKMQYIGLHVELAHHPLMCECDACAACVAGFCHMLIQVQLLNYSNTGQ